MGFPGGLDGKESVCRDARDLGSIPRLGRSPGGGHDNPLQYSCLENPHGQRSLAGYSPWGWKESDMIEWLGTAEQTRIYCVNTFFSFLISMNLSLIHKSDTYSILASTFYTLVSCCFIFYIWLVKPLLLIWLQWQQIYVNSFSYHWKKLSHYIVLFFHCNMS